MGWGESKIEYRDNPQLLKQIANLKKINADNNNHLKKLAQQKNKIKLQYASISKSLESIEQNRENQNRKYRIQKSLQQSKIQKLQSILEQIQKSKSSNIQLQKSMIQIKSQLKIQKDNFQSLNRQHQSNLNQISNLQCQMRIQKRTTEKKIQQQQSQIFQISQLYQSSQNQILNLKKNQTQQQKQLRESVQKYNQIYKQLSSFKDPKQIKQNQLKIFINFLQQLKSFNVMNPLPKIDGIKYVAIIGKISSGKSSILNWIFNINLNTGPGQVTQKIQKVYTLKNLVYFDSPGLSQELTILNPQLLQAFYSINHVFIIQNTSFKMCKKLIQVFHKINPPKFTLVRSKCDQFKDNQIQNQKGKDKKFLQQINVNREVLYVSVKMPDSYQDNSKFKKYMKNQI